ncbi:MAG: cbb3-type cytochrome oxidase assembly protein CcoS [Phycisphaerales bacterium]|nr:cbb3-type cytochrome oxidase assembly protein CcoS [Phycisphaerales bacterium]
MSVILIMIPAALLLAGLGVLAFILAAKNGQFDDLDTPALRAVFDDDDLPKGKPENSTQENELDELDSEHED